MQNLRGFGVDKHAVVYFHFTLCLLPASALLISLFYDQAVFACPTRRWLFSVHLYHLSLALTYYPAQISNVPVSHIQQFLQYIHAQRLSVP